MNDMHSKSLPNSVKHLSEPVLRLFFCEKHVSELCFVTQSQHTSQNLCTVLGSRLYSQPSAHNVTKCFQCVFLTSIISGTPFATLWSSFRTKLLWETCPLWKTDRKTPEVLHWESFTRHFERHVVYDYLRTLYCTCRYEVRRTRS